MKILWRSDKEKTTFKAIEKYRYGLCKTVSKHLKRCYVFEFRNFKGVVSPTKPVVQAKKVPLFSDIKLF